MIKKYQFYYEVIVFKNSFKLPFKYLFIDEMLEIENGLDNLRICVSLATSKNENVNESGIFVSSLSL